MDNLLYSSNSNLNLLLYMLIFHYLYQLIVPKLAVLDHLWHKNSNLFLLNIEDSVLALPPCKQGATSNISKPPMYILQAQFFQKLVQTQIAFGHTSFVVSAHNMVKNSNRSGTQSTLSLKSQL